ncbi:hypothetical protein [Alcanivorax jadensis]|uniref:hypothetical protein n=1 Tax=Alcanivorax jadensis TaxID=64988 RepID=UPI002409576D|nr:hypothetical protein [Alcanivorax jadensis]MDF1637849.1 hypothetical protein [Alcanivorax jadensis]
MPSLGLPRLHSPSSSDATALFITFFLVYVGLAWIVCGGDRWWVIDFVDNENIFHGDDAYRFFLSRSAWINPDLYTYNFVLPGQLLLDGSITALLSGDLFLARCFHAAFGAAAISLVYLSGIELKIPRITMLSAVLLMGLLPRYALMSLSFYGEAWLSFFICLSLWFYLKKKYIIMAFVASWMPLLRPEGFFFLAPLCLQMLLKKRFSEFLLLLLPGSLYFFYLFFSLESLSDYTFWRMELRKILEKVARRTSIGDPLEFYSFFLVAPAGLALFLRKTLRLWPFIMGGIVWLAWLQASIIQGLAAFENRHFYILLPLVAMLWAIFISWIKVSLTGSCRVKYCHKMGSVAVAALALFVASKHIIKTDNLDQEIRKNGYSGLFNKVSQGRWDELYGYYPRKSLEGRKEIAEIASEILSRDSVIDKLAISTAVIFYEINPNNIPKDVTVGFLTNNYLEFYKILDGQTFIQHPGKKMYTYLDYGEPDFRPGEKRALIISPMPLSNYPYTWVRGANQLYLFSYLESWAPKTNIEEIPRLIP